MDYNIGEISSEINEKKKELGCLTLQVQQLEEETKKAGVVSQYIRGKCAYLAETMKEIYKESESEGALFFSVGSQLDLNVSYDIILFPDIFLIDYGEESSVTCSLNYDGQIVSEDEMECLHICAAEKEDVEAPSKALVLREFFLGLPDDKMEYRRCAFEKLESDIFSYRAECYKKEVQKICLEKMKSFL